MLSWRIELGAVPNGSEISEDRCETRKYDHGRTARLALALYGEHVVEIDKDRRWGFFGSCMQSDQVAIAFLPFLLGLRDEHRAISLPGLGMRTFIPQPAQ